MNSKVLTDKTGNKDQTRDYHPYGVTRTASGSVSAYQFSGKEKDATGLYYFGARYYDPGIGRWLSLDPAGQGWSPYAYCGNNPIIMVDPDGKFVFLIAGILVGGYFGYQIGTDRGATGWDLVAYTLGGAAIGAASGGLGYMASAAGGGGFVGGMVGGLAGGASQGFGMGHLAGMHGSDVWEATWKGGLSGLVGGSVGAGIGGEIGAFAGGFSAGATGAALYGGNFGQCMQAGMIGGSLGLASYNIESAIRYSRTTSDPIFDEPANRKAMSEAAQKSFAYGKEEGGWLRSDNSPERFPTGTKSGIGVTEKPIDANGIFHTHPNRGVNWKQDHSFSDMVANNTYAKVNSYVVSRSLVYVHLPNTWSSSLVGATNYYLMVNSYNLWYFGNKY